MAAGKRPRIWPFITPTNGSWRPKSLVSVMTPLAPNASSAAMIRTMPYVHLVRHAQPDFAGHYDSLTALGVQQSAWLGEHYASLGQSFDRLVSGSLERQRATLRVLAANLPVQREPTVDPRWNEYDAAD